MSSVDKVRQELQEAYQFTFVSPQQKSSNVMKVNDSDNVEFNVT